VALALEGVFRNEFPIELPGAGFEQFVKGGTDGGFVFDAELFKFGLGCRNKRQRPCAWA
jgi:hypothetical protein